MGGLLLVRSKGVGVGQISVGWQFLMCCLDSRGCVTLLPMPRVFRCPVTIFFAVFYGHQPETDGCAGDGNGTTPAPVDFGLRSNLQAAVSSHRIPAALVGTDALISRDAAFEYFSQMW